MDTFLKKPVKSASSGGRGHLGTVTAAERAKQYKSGEFYEDGGRLFCRTCNVVVTHQRKSTVDDHLQSASHVRHSQCPDPKKQKTIDTTLNIGTVAAENRVAVCRDWVKMLVAANIPISKSDHPQIREFLRTRVVNGGAIPKTSQLVECYLPDLYESERKRIMNEFVNCAALAIIVDETSDDQGRFVLNILFAKMEQTESGANKSYLAETIFLQNTNNVTVSQSVVRVVTDFGISFDSVRIFCTDNAAYMGKAFRDTLSVIFPNCIHMTCMAHLMNLVCEAFRKPFADVHKFGVQFRKFFSIPGIRKARYLKHLKDVYPTVAATLAPDPVATRWNSWYEAMTYHNEHFPCYSTFFESEKSIAGSSASANLTWLCTLFSQSAEVAGLQVKLAFLSDKSVSILKLMAFFESRIPCAIDIYEKLEDLQIHLETNCQLSSESCEQFFHCAPDMSTDDKLRITEQFQEAFQLATDKVQKYLDGSQPAIQFLKACRIFNPKNTVLLSTRKIDYSAVPGFDRVTDEEFLKYVNVLSVEAVRNSSDVKPLDILNFWKSIGDRAPQLAKLAQMYLFSVTTSADAERSFSKYNQLLTPQRTSLSESTLRMLEFLYWNLNVESATQLECFTSSTSD